ncbi:MAG: rRNA pseudouridine synthase [Gammaproteobacteria bacterium]|nr:rRNA pseudouridine synthase [Gammaproteobacteria bacterium]
MSEKIQKILAHAGYGSRREIEGWIDAGRITVNGKRAKLGDRATTADRMLLDGKLLQLASRGPEVIKALLYHKPEGEICTRSDPQGRPTIFEKLPAISGGRWVSVGRLDVNTSGLLLLTNNGELANQLMHPSTGVEREYLARIRGIANPQTIERLTNGKLKIDGKSARFESVSLADMAEEGTNHWYRVVIKEGRYREVRRMWEACGHTVSRLKRIRYGTVKLSRDLKSGRAAKMAPKQLEKLVVSAGLGERFKSKLYSASERQTTGARSTGKSSGKSSGKGGAKGKPQSRRR